ncbi:MAG: valine--tRNA ligase [Deltaproteobacteria bacterium]|nr:valine--tRNA ligase [Deltaproteobacteria bacterium]
MELDRYSPALLEEKWYRYWTDRGLFQPSMDKNRPPFCIVIPPPNVTGSLHMGHAWDNTLQDLLIRWERMRGKNTLWVPGTDHAGIATQWMVEKMLRKDGKTKEGLGREAFLKTTHAFAEESKRTITGQLRRLGVSCDWSRERFTLDEGLTRAVRREFVELHRRGLVRRDKRLVNWCPRCLTALSDLEVNHEEKEGGMWHIRYPLAQGGGHIVVATTRPETLLGDTAVAVHPEDERYKDLVGKMVNLPLTGRAIPIVADDYCDPSFGSGAVKVTPGHDPNDFAIGQRHNLPILTVMNDDATLNDLAPEAYRGMDRFKARQQMVEDLAAQGLLEGHKKHVHMVGGCSRCHTVVEPRVSLQWFVSMEAMARRAVEAVRSKQIELLPDYQEKIFYEWMNNIQDWCVSRQLWWGHRIPVWYCSACGTEHVSEQDLAACPACGGGLTQDPDVLDTWFSSGLWPFSVMGWPENTPELKTFYPTSVLVTGYDILFFWVARMAMLGLTFMDEVPFRQVFLHGLLRDKNGEKMSKTKGNGIDPLEVIDQHGADALRFTLAAQTVMGKDMSLSEAAIVGYRNFINKIWNATRFYLGHQERLGPPPAWQGRALGPFDQWILSRADLAAGEANRHMEARRFNEAAKALYQFVWGELCDWYVETAKPSLTGGDAQRALTTLGVLRSVLDQALRLLHPFMPFVTEELWQALRGDAQENERQGLSVMVQPYPQGGEYAAPAEQVARAGGVIAVVEALRAIRGEYNVPPKHKIEAVLVTTRDDLKLAVEGEGDMLRFLAGVARLDIAPAQAERKGYSSAVGEGFEVLVSLAGLVDTAAERARMGKEMGRLKEKAEMLAAKLDNPAFRDKAPPAVIEKNRAELASLEEQMAALANSLEALPG